MSATAMDNVRSATPGQVRRSPSVPAHWPIRRHVAAAETTPAGPLHSVEVTVPAKTNLTLHVGPAHEEWGGRHALDTIYCAIGVNDVTIEVDPAMGNAFQEAAAHITFVFSVEDNELNFHDIPLMELIKQYGTPLKITYLPKIGRRIRRRGGDIARREHPVGTALAD